MIHLAYSWVRTEDLCEPWRFIYATHVIHFIDIVRVIDVDFIGIDSDNWACNMVSAKLPMS